MKIVIDSAIPYIEGVFESFADVVYSSDITADLVVDADALITRTRTRCNSSLLEGSSVEIIASATIGFDHIDMEFCEANNIRVERAAGCNSRAVLQWFASALNHLTNNGLQNLEGLTIGVIGVGSVGSLICKYAELWGAKIIACDPPRERRDPAFKSTPLEELLPHVDILTFHTPLDHSTHHLLNEKNIGLTKPNCTIINSSRGEVVCSKALLKSGRQFILDVWENEPNLDLKLLDKAELATPHIAGYSQQGKAMATTLSVRHLAHHFNLPLKEWQAPIPNCEPHAITWAELQRTIPQYFDIEALSQKLKNSPHSFENLRNNYNYRTDYF